MPRRVLDLLSSWAVENLRNYSLLFDVKDKESSAVHLKSEMVRTLPKWEQATSTFFAFNLDLLSFLDSLYLG